MTTPLVLVPGLLCDHRLFAAQIAALPTPTTRQVVELREETSIAAMAARVLAEAPPRFALAGLSMGGYVAIEVALTAPERVARLALLATRARADTPEERARRGQVVELARRDGLDPVVDRLLPLFLGEAAQTDARLVATVKAMAAAVGAEAFARQQAALIGRADRMAALPRIGCPTLVLCGREDALTPPERSREIAEAIADATLVVLPRCGHLATLEQPQAVTAQLRVWLAA